MQFFYKLRSRLIFLLLVTVVPAFLLMIYSSFEWRNQDIQLVKENILRSSRYVATNLDRDFLGVKALLRSLTNHPAIQNFNEEEVRQQFQQTVTNSPLYENIGLLNTNGETAVAAVPLKNQASEKWFQDLLAKKSFSLSSYYLYSNNVPTIHIGIPVLDREGEVRHLLFASVGTAWIHSLARDSQLPEGAALTVNDESGGVLARYPDPEKWVGTIQATQPMIDTANPLSGLTEAKGIDGVQRIYAYTKLTEVDFYVRIGVTRESVYQAANRALNRNVAILGIASLAALAMAWIGGHMFFINPIRALSAAAKRIAQGDLSARVNTTDKGELGQLGSTFNEMAESLQWRDAQLREADSDYANILKEIDKRGSQR